MDVVLWGISALRLYRIPPWLRKGLAARFARAYLLHRPSTVDQVAVDLIGRPVHVMVRERAARWSLKHAKCHLWSADLPAGAVEECGPYVSCAAPEFALLQLAPFVPYIHLCMLLHEVCGGFAVCELPDAVRDELQALVEKGWHGSEGWCPVLDGAGRLTDLWQRPACVEVGSVARFAERNVSARGGARLLRATQDCFGCARSPFEVRAALQYGLSRMRGGEGRRVRLDGRIDLSRSGRILADQSVCYADLLAESRDGSKQLVIECQSRLIHSTAERQLLDFDRQVALQAMGYEYIPLTYAQLKSDERHREMAELVGMKLEGRYLEKSALLRERERSLRRELFCDWRRLGEV